MGTGQTPHIPPMHAESLCALGPLWLCPAWAGAAEGRRAGLGSSCVLGGPVPLCDHRGGSSASWGWRGPKDRGCLQCSTPLVLSKELRGGSGEPGSSLRACEGMESQGGSRERSLGSPSWVGCWVIGAGDAALGADNAPLAVGNAPPGAGIAPLDVGDAPLGTGGVGRALARGTRAPPPLSIPDWLAGVPLAGVPSPPAPLARVQFEAGLLRGLAG